MDQNEDNLIALIKKTIIAEISNSDFSIDLVCRKVGISRSHLHRKIKEFSGQSTSLYIRKIKLAHAKDLLESTSKNISEIAYAVGINSPQNFSRYFVKAYGLSPTAYRRQLGSAKLESKMVVPDTTTTKNNNGTFRKLMAGSIVLLLLITTTLYYFKSQETSPNYYSGTSTLKGQFTNSIAILPFLNLGDEKNDFISTGILEDITTNLARIEDLKVISRTSCMQYANTKKSIKQISSELDVAYVLEGSIRTDQNQLRITAQLIRAADDAHVWAKNYDRDLTDIITIQNDVAKDIANALNQKMSRHTNSQIASIPTQNTGAYNAALIGRKLTQSRSSKDLLAAIERFDEAITLDSTYADAYAFKAIAIQVLKGLRYSSLIVDDDIITNLILTALKYDPVNSHAYSLLANTYVDDYKWDQAKYAYDIALEQDPNNAQTNYWYSLLLRALGDIDQALEFNSKAIMLDPLHPTYFAGYVATNVYGDRYEAAKGLLEKQKDLFQDEFIYYWVQGIYLQAIGEHAQAIASLDQALSMNPGTRSPTISKLYGQGRLGNEEVVLDYINSLDTESAINHHTKAVLFLSIDQYETAITHLLKAAEMGFVASDILVDPTYESFIQDPRLEPVLKSFGFL